jgi:hypothetical protein
VHGDAAAYAALLALDRGTGAFNVAEPNGYLATDKVGTELGWDAGFRLPGRLLAAEQPRRRSS